MGKSTINGHFKSLFACLPEGGLLDVVESPCGAKSQMMQDPIRAAEEHMVWCRLNLSLVCKSQAKLQVELP